MARKCGIPFNPNERRDLTTTDDILNLERRSRELKRLEWDKTHTLRVSTGPHTFSVVIGKGREGCGEGGIGGVA